jgi:hypothetical protein
MRQDGKTVNRLKGQLDFWTEISENDAPALALDIINTLYSTIKSEALLSGDDEIIIRRLNFLANTAQTLSVLCEKCGPALVRIEPALARELSEAKRKIAEFKDSHADVFTKREELEKDNELLQTLRSGADSIVAEQDTKKSEKLRSLGEFLDRQIQDCKVLEEEQRNKVGSFRAALDAFFKIHDENKEIFAHIRENEYIMEKLLSLDITNAEDVKRKGTEMSRKAKEAAACLEEYDTLLGELVEKARAAKEDLLRLQEQKT